MAFVPRLSTSSPTNLYTSPWYMSNGNWFYANGYYYPPPNGNCTWYAYGRYAEVKGAFANLPLGNGGTWFDNATSFNRGFYNQGALPQLGCICCFKSPSGNFPGHVTMVEQINADGSIVISNSGYVSNPTSDTSFWTATVYPQNDYMQPWYHQGGRDYILQGFIYQDSSPTPPTPPAPTPTPFPFPTQTNKMPLWFYLRRF